MQSGCIGADCMMGPSIDSTRRQKCMPTPSSWMLVGRIHADADGETKAILMYAPQTILTQRIVHGALFRPASVLPG